MKNQSSSLFGRIILLIAGLITGLGLLFMVITYTIATNYHEASMQLLNRDVAVHIAKFSTPFGANGLDKQKADSVFYDAMVLSPTSEVYFLDTTGKVAGYHPSEYRVTEWTLPLKKIEAYIASAGRSYIKGPDPRDPSCPKIFSAAQVISNGKRVGYIYVILAGSQSRLAASTLFGNHAIILSITAFSLILLLSLILSLMYVRQIQKRFDRVVAVLNRFEEGDFNARFEIQKGDGLADVKSAFNKMADLLVYHINRLTKSETDRKVFIAGITHDLRNPLAIAGGYAETLLIKGADGTLNAYEQHDYAKLVVQKVKLVEKLVTQLHDLSAMESVSFGPKPEPFMFSELVQEVAHSFRQKAAEHGVAINCKDCEDDAYVLADVSMMERVMQNLLANAVANSPEEAAIIVRLVKERDNLTCQFENGGLPLPDVMIQWLTDGTDSVQTSVPQTSALGLSIVKRILNAHHFPLQVACRDNRIVFSFRMPVYATQTGRQL